MPLWLSADFFKIDFLKNSFRNIIRVSSGLDQSTSEAKGTKFTFFQEVDLVPLACKDVDQYAEGQRTVGKSWHLQGKLKFLYLTFMLPIRWS